MLIVGALLMVLGLGSGLFLTLGSLHALPALPGISLWFLYPGLAVAGYLIVALASRPTNLAALSRFAGGSMLALALVAAFGLVLSSTAIVPQAESPLALWFVLGVGLLLGTAGLTAHRPISGPV